MFKLNACILVHGFEPTKMLNELCRTEAQRGLIRVLRALVSSEERCTDVVKEALRSGGDRDALPTDPSELVAFARAHLAEPLTREIGEILAGGCLDALDLEIEKAKSRPPPPLAAGGSPSGGQPPPPPQAARRDSVLPERMKSAILSGCGSVNASKASDGRATVLLVHSDCVVRATIARALVIGGFDVSAFEAMNEISIDSIPAASGGARTIAIVNLDDAKDESALKTVLASVNVLSANAKLGVVARTDQSDAAAHGALVNAGVNRAILVRRNASDVELVEATRKMDRGLKGA
jgi:hypothetical protein